MRPSVSSAVIPQPIRRLRMGEEQKRILEMLSEGKLSVDEAERLLTAVADHPKDQKTERRTHDDIHENDGFDFLGGLGDEIRAGMAQAEAALSEFGPDAAAAVRRAERAVRRSIRRSTRGRGRRGFGGRRSEEEATRRLTDSRPLEPGADLTIRNRKGDVLLETWDKAEVSFKASIVTRARTVEDARILADSIVIDVLSADGGLRIETSLPNEDGELRGSWRVDFHIQIPEKLDLDIESQHGQIRIPNIQGDVSVRNAQGATSIESIDGSLRVRQSHGKFKADSVDGDASIDARHGQLEVEKITGALTLQNHHGHVTIGRVAKDFELFSAHGNVTVGSVGGAVEGRIRHCDLRLRDDAAGKVTLDASHGSLHAKNIGGDLVIKVRHGSIEAERVGGSINIDASHSPISIRSTARDAALCTSHSNVTLENVGGDAVIDANHSAISVSKVKGKVEITSSRGRIDVSEALRDVTIDADRGSVTITPDGPITDNYRIVSNRAPVDLLIPEGSDVEIQGTVNLGKIECSLSSIEVIQSNKGTQTLSGKLGEGTAKVRMEIQKASLRLRTE